MTTSLEWSRTTLVPTAVALNMRPNNTSGGVSLAGTEQVIANSPGRWAVTFQNIYIATREHILSWTEIAANLQGRLNPIIIPIYDKQRAPEASTDATVDGLTTAGATAINIDVASGGPILPGMHFSNPLTERLYRLVSVGDPTGEIYPCTIWPPLRNSLGDGYHLEFDDPVFRVKLAADNGMDMILDLLKRASPTVEWVEDV